MFKGHVDERLYKYAEQLAIYGVKPLADQPPVRSKQMPYATVGENPQRTACDLWGDLVKDRLLVCTEATEALVGPLMESRLAYLNQPGPVNPDLQKARYISDRRVAINERIATDRRPRCISPKQQNVARRVLYWKRRYQGWMFFRRNAM